MREYSRARLEAKYPVRAGLCVLLYFSKALAVTLGSNGSVKFYKETLPPPSETFMKTPSSLCSYHPSGPHEHRSRGKLILALPEARGSPPPSVNRP
jgi:hypothetical protein